MSSPLVQKIIKKPTVLVLFPLIYFICVILLKWKLTFSPDIFLYFIGSVIGVYLLDITEYFFNVHPSPFRSVLFWLGLFVVSIYTITSTREMIAVGLVLSVSFSTLLYLISEWRIHKNIDSWFTIIFDPPSVMVQKMVVLVSICIVVFETMLFIGI